MRPAPQDPEGLLAAPKGGHISRRMLSRQAQDDEELKEQMDKAREEARQELSAQREVRAAAPGAACIRRAVVGLGSTGVQLCVTKFWTVDAHVAPRVAP